MFLIMTVLVLPLPMAGWPRAQLRGIAVARPRAAVVPAPDRVQIPKDLAVGHVHRIVPDSADVLQVVRVVATWLLL